MRNKMFWRWGELGAVFSLLIWLILTPFMATIWVYDGGRLVWEQKPLLVRTIGQWLADQGAFTFAAEEVVYHSYGRYFFLVYLLLIPTVMAVHHRYATENKRHHCWYKILLRFARRCHKRLCFVWSGDFFPHSCGKWGLAWKCWLYWWSLLFLCFTDGPVTSKPIRPAGWAGCLSLAPSSYRRCFLSRRWPVTGPTARRCPWF